MSAEILRRAAALMRERAEAAIASLSDNVPEWHSVRDLMGEGKTQGDAEHIASWHPAVALAVAGWLDEEANEFAKWEHPDLDELGQLALRDGHRHALAVARAYLGEQP